MTQAQAAGKLFIAGEYAVVEPARLAVLVAVDRYAQVQVHQIERGAPLGAQASVHARHYAPQVPQWHLSAEGLASQTLRVAHDMVYAVAALVDQLLRERGLPRAVYQLEVGSNLASADGRKYGLGSSAAVSVACLRALNAALQLALSEQELLKLGLLASWMQNPKGSGGDVAASVLGGWLLYASPERAWVQQCFQQQGLQACLAASWPSLRAQRLATPQSIALLVGWTGSPASTPALMGAPSAPVPAALLDASDAAVRALVAALARDDAQAIMGALEGARGAVGAIAQARGRTLETPELRTLCALAHAHGAAAKTSGAGGGDCGIAMLPSGQSPDALYAAWRAQGIEPLTLQVAEVGAVGCAAAHTSESLK